MAWSKVESQYAEIIPPMQGAMAVLSINSTPTVVDLTTLPPSPAAKNVSAAANIAFDPSQQNPIGKYVRVAAMSNAVYCAVGSNAVALSTINPNATTAIGGGVLTLTGNECFPIPAGAYIDIFIVPGGTPQAQNPPGANSPCRYLGLVSISTATAILAQSSI